MRNAKLVQPPHEPTSAVKQIELIPLAAVYVERLQAAEILCLCLYCDDSVLPQLIRPAFFDYFACVERDGQPNPKKLRGIRIVAGGHRQRVDHLKGALRMLLSRF